MGLLSDLFKLGGSLIGAGKAKKASRGAQEALVQAANKGIDQIGTGLNSGMELLAPWQTAGAGAVGAYGDLLGLNGAAGQQGAISAISGSPQYGALFDSGQEAILQSASATGGLRGGNTQRSLAGFGSDLLASLIDSQLSRLGGLSGQGLTAANAGAGLNANAAMSIADLFKQQGAAQSGGILTRGGINAQNWNNIGDFAGNAFESILSGGLGGGGGGGTMAGAKAGGKVGF